MSPNWKPRTIWTGDNLHVMRGMNSGSVDLIYFDPPFKRNANYAAPIGSKEASAAFKDTWTLSEIDVEWINLMEQKHPALYRAVQAGLTPSDRSYLAYMSVRILEMHRLLKPTGSIYLHCDPTMGHYLRTVMDAVFGKHQFRNEIVWSYHRWTGATKHFQRMHDTILFYAMSHQATFNVLKESYSEKSKHQAARKSKVVGSRLKQSYTKDKSRQKDMRDVWEISYLNSQAKERVGPPTQKPLALIERIIEASSNPGDVVIDPFCGTATTCIASEMLQRDWVGIDISPKAADFVRQRMRMQLDRPYKGPHRTGIPRRTDLGRIPAYNSPANRKKLYGEQEGLCAGCGHHFEARHLEVDHIVSRSKGGTDHIENLQLLCSSCNRIKGDRSMEYLKSKLRI